MHDPRLTQPGDIITFMDGDGLERILVMASVVRDDGVPIIGGIPCDERGRVTATRAHARTCVQSQVLLVNGAERVL